MIGPASVGIVVALLSRARVEPSTASGLSFRLRSEAGAPPLDPAGPVGSTRCELGVVPAGLALWLGWAGLRLACAMAGIALAQSTISAPEMMVLMVSLRCSAMGLHRANT